MAMPMKKYTGPVILIFLLLAFTETSIPYFYAQQKCLPDHVFLGQVISTFDQNMYFSYIRQAMQGHFLFTNRLTYIDHHPAFINLEFWMVGIMQHITGAGENTLYTLWRLCGAFSLVTGIVLFSGLLLPNLKKVCFAVSVYLFAGGIGFVHALLNVLGARNAAANWPLFGNARIYNLALDSSSLAIPFNQLMTNPHFTLPTGMVLMGFYFFLMAEFRGGTRNYWISGLLFLLIGFIRPYDIIPISIVLPLYVAISPGSNLSSTNRLHSIAARLIPFGLLIPALVYNVWLFRYHPVFRYWSSQGDNSQMIPDFWVHYVNFGIAGLLALVRLALIKKIKPRQGELFLALLFVVTLCVNHLGRYTELARWSFQVGGYATAPLIILGCMPAYREIFSRRKIYTACMCGVIAIVLASNYALVSYRCYILGDRLNRTHMYARRSEYESWMWMRDHSREGEVLLASVYTSSRIAKYTDLRVVAGHPFVTPDYERTCLLAQQIDYDSVLTPNSKKILDSFRVDYLYVGAGEKRYNNYHIKADEYIKPVFTNDVADIYRITRPSGR
jgi:hypothetical protein